MSKVKLTNGYYTHCKRCGGGIPRSTDVIFVTSEINTPLSDSVPYERWVICKDCYQDFYRWMGANNNA